MVGGTCGGSGGACCQIGSVTHGWDAVATGGDGGGYTSSDRLGRII